MIASYGCVKVAGEFLAIFRSGSYTCRALQLILSKTLITVIHGTISDDTIAIVMQIAINLTFCICFDRLIQASSKALAFFRWISTDNCHVWFHKPSTAGVCDTGKQF